MDVPTDQRTDGQADRPTDLQTDIDGRTEMGAVQVGWSAQHPCLLTAVSTYVMFTRRCWATGLVSVLELAMMSVMALEMLCLHLISSHRSSMNDLPAAWKDRTCRRLNLYRSSQTI